MTPAPSVETQVLGIAEQLRRLSLALTELVETFDRERIERAERTKRTAAAEGAAERIQSRVADAPTPETAIPVPPKDDSPDGLSKLELKICQAIYHQGPLTKQQIAYFAGISIGSGSVIRAYAGLLEDGILVSDGGRLSLDAQLPRVHDLTQTFDAAPRKSVYLQAFYDREGEHIAKIVGAALKLPSGTGKLDELCEEAEVSKASGSTIKAFSRLKTLGILERHRGWVNVSPWFLEANAPEIRVRDAGTGVERLHNAKTGTAR